METQTQPTTRRFKKRYMLLIALGLLMLLGYLKGGTDSTSTAQQAAVIAPDPIAVTSHQLYRAYHANEVAADNEYKGKVLHVTGTIRGIKKDAGGDVYILLQTDNRFLSVNCELLEPGISAQLQKGNDITIQGTGRGMSVGSPILKDCIIVQ